MLVGMRRVVEGGVDEEPFVKQQSGSQLPFSSPDLHLKLEWQKAKSFYTAKRGRETLAKTSRFSFST